MLERFAERPFLCGFLAGKDELMEAAGEEERRICLLYTSFCLKGTDTKRRLLGKYGFRYSGPLTVGRRLQGGMPRQRYSAD